MWIWVIIIAIAIGAFIGYANSGKSEDAVGGAMAGGCMAEYADVYGFDKVIYSALQPYL